METAMTTTTSLKLPDELKATIAKVAQMEGKTAHALMVETLQSAMEDALARQQFYAEGAAAYEDTLRTNAVYRSDDVHAYPKARVAGEKPTRPKAVALDARKPIRRAKN